MTSEKLFLDLSKTYISIIHYGDQQLSRIVEGILTDYLLDSNQF